MPACCPARPLLSALLLLHNDVLLEGLSLFSRRGHIERARAEFVVCAGPLVCLLFLSLSSLSHACHNLLPIRGPAETACACMPRHLGAGAAVLVREKHYHHNHRSHTGSVTVPRSDVNNVRRATTLQLDGGWRVSGG